MNERAAPAASAAEAVDAGAANVRLRALGDAAWTVELGDAIDAPTHARVMGLAQALTRARAAGDLPGVIEWVPAFRSLTVYFDALATDAEALAARLRQLGASATRLPSAGRRWRLPVYFGAAAGPDLEALAAHAGLSVEGVIARLTGTVFEVYMLGFMPGFPYMGGLPAELAMPRLATPRKLVPQRSLAVAGRLCAIYPWDSPGGWRLLGRTPLPLFDAGDGDSPSLLAPGDQVMWQAIDASRYAQLEAETRGARLQRSDFLIGADGAWPV